MRVLAVDTATELCTVALWSNGELLERELSQPRGHLERLPGMVSELFAQAGCAPTDLDALVAGIGPGSFSGVRVGVAFVKGMALALDRPTWGVSSLEMLARSAAASYPRTIRWWSAIDARMGEVYWAEYRRGEDGGLNATESPRVLAPQRLPPADPTPPPGAVGSGWSAHRSALVSALGTVPEPMLEQALPRAADAVHLALPYLRAGKGFDAARLVPLYLRERVALTAAEQRAAGPRRRPK